MSMGISIISGQDHWDNFTPNDAYLVVTVGKDGIKTKYADKDDCIKAAASGILSKIYACKDFSREELQYTTTYTPKGTLVKVMNALNIPVFQGFA